MYRILLALLLTSSVRATAAVEEEEEETAELVLLQGEDGGLGSYNPIKLKGTVLCSSNRLRAYHIKVELVTDKGEILASNVTDMNGQYVLEEVQNGERRKDTGLYVSVKAQNGQGVITEQKYHIEYVKYLRQSIRGRPIAIPTIDINSCDYVREPIHPPLLPDINDFEKLLILDGVINCGGQPWKNAPVSLLVCALDHCSASYTTETNAKGEFVLYGSWNWENRFAVVLFNNTTSCARCEKASIRDKNLNYFPSINKDVYLRSTLQAFPDLQQLCNAK